ncbi:MAG: TonB-dependent receptor [Bacteroidales bacterium]|jgi:hypothetical protein|nr:TonB-dependent receptor [Bacteroidales bacterium]
MRIYFKVISILLVCLTCAGKLLAQEGILKGLVYDQSTGEPVPYASLVLNGDKYTSSTLSTSHGDFIFSKIPKGTFVLQISIIGYEHLLDTIQIDLPTSHLSRKFALKRTAQFLEVVQVRGEVLRDLQETRTAVVSVSPKELSRMPSIGGQPDFAQYLQVLPGIVSTGDQGGQLYVRGGTPIQNMLLLDGMLVVNPFHSIGLFAVFDADILNTADVYTGGFGAEFGGRISSVMNVQTRDGNKKNIAGKIDINTFGAKILLEGPIYKLKDNRKSALTYILSAKGSFLEKSAPIFYPYANSLPYQYLDLYGKIAFSNLNGSKLQIFGFKFDDKVNYSDIAVYQWQNWGAGTKFVIVPGSVATTIEGSVSYSRYNTALQENVENYLPRSNSMDVYSAGMTFNYFAGKSTFNAGFDLLGYTTKYALGSTETIDYAFDPAVFAKYKYNLHNKLLIEPSFRLQMYLSQRVASPEPRLAVKYNITPKIRLKAAGGLYSQNYVSIESDRDVVNLFSGFLSSVEGSQLPGKFDGKELNSTIQKAQHAILGLELDLIKYTTINIEGFFKNFSVLTSANRYKMFNDDSEHASTPEILKKEYIWEKGYAYGGDLSAKFEYKNLYVWLSYSLGWVKRVDPMVTYSPHFDRRHNINLLCSYAFGKRASWQVDLRWNFGSGFPFTRTTAYFPYMSFSQNINYDYVHANEDVDFILDDLNTGRLPNYHRLDISIKKKFYFAKRQTIEVSLSATNVYNRQNLFYVNRVSNEIIYQLPILYNVGLSWRF